MTRVEGSKLHTVICRQPGNVNVGSPSLLEVVAKASRFAAAVIEKAAVAVDLGTSAFWEDLAPTGLIQRRYKVGTWRILNAVVGPEDLGQPVKIDQVAGLSSGMIVGKTAVCGRVPILGRHNQVEVCCKRLTSGTI